MQLPQWLRGPHHENASLTVRALVTVLLLVVLGVTIYFLIGDVVFHRAVSPLASPRHFRGMLQPAAPPTVDAIADWMTFEYLNRVFRLSSDVLQQALGITDARYPRLSIRRWASTSGTDVASALLRVKEAVRAAQMK